MAITLLQLAIQDIVSQALHQPLFQQLPFVYLCLTRPGKGKVNITQTIKQRKITQIKECHLSDWSDLGFQNENCKHQQLFNQKKFHIENSS